MDNENDFLNEAWEELKKLASAPRDISTKAGATDFCNKIRAWNENYLVKLHKEYDVPLDPVLFDRMEHLYECLDRLMELIDNEPSLN